MKLQELIEFMKTWWPLAVVGGLYMYLEKVRNDTLNKHTMSSQQRKAQNPPIDKYWKKKQPEGVVLGKTDKHTYYCVPERATEHGYEMQHVLVIGGSGCGKTTSVLGETLLTNFYNEEVAPDKAFRGLVVDVKGEIHNLYAPPLKPIDEDPDDTNRYYLIDPTDPEHSVGYDPFGLVDDTDIDDIIQTSSDIAGAFIQKDPKNAYFTSNAQTLLSGFVAACIESSPRINLVDMLRRVLTEGVKTVMKDVYESSLPGSATQFFIGRFMDKGDSNESFEDIASTATTALSCMGLHSVEFILKSNPRKITAASIRKKTIIMAVPDFMLDDQTYAPLMRLYIVQSMKFLTSKLPEPGTPPTMLMLDELFSVCGSDGGAPLSGLLHYISISRGYGSAGIYVVQGLQMLRSLWGENAKIILDNCLKCVLQATDASTTKDLISIIGTFDERKVSTSNGKKMTSTISWAKEPIYDSGFFSDLVSKKTVIAIPLTGHHAKLIKSQFFSDPYYRRLQEKITHPKEEKDNN